MDLVGFVLLCALPSRHRSGGHCCSMAVVWEDHKASRHRRDRYLHTRQREEATKRGDALGDTVSPLRSLNNLQGETVCKFKDLRLEGVGHYDHSVGAGH